MKVTKLIIFFIMSCTNTENIFKNIFKQIRLFAVAEQTFCIYFRVRTRNGRCSFMFQ
jgi:hypothetical protein